MEVELGARSTLWDVQVKSAQRGVGELDQEMHLWRAADVKRGNLELTDASRKGGSCKEIRPKNSNLRARQAAAKRKTNLLMSLGLDWFLEKDIYLGSRFIQNGLFLARPDPMNHVWGADLSESPNIPPVVAKAPSQCGRSFKTRRQKLSKHKILLVASNGQNYVFKFTKPSWYLRIFVHQIVNNLIVLLR